MHKRYACLCFTLAGLGSVLLLAAPQAWKEKRIADWTPENARQVLTDSPWAKSVTPSPDGKGSLGQQKVGMNPGGIGIGGVGIGLPGMGRRGGRGGSGRGQNGQNTDSGAMPALTLRWVSALPVSAAEVILRELNAPAVDDAHYAIAVYGIPSSMTKGDPAGMGAELKKHATIQRDGKKELKPSSVDVLIHEEGPVIVYFFARSDEISRKDHVKFDAEIGRLKVSQDFLPDEMIYQGKLEL